MKPDWKDIPWRANWICMDANGQWVWFEVEPVFDTTDMQWCFPARADLRARCGEIVGCVSDDVTIEKAKASLEPRP